MYIDHEKVINIPQSFIISIMLPPWHHVASPCLRSCRSIDLNRKGLIEDDGDSLAGMLEKNKGDGWGWIWWWIDG